MKEKMISPLYDWKAGYNLASIINFLTNEGTTLQTAWYLHYEELRQSITIVICDHNLLEEESSYINVYELRNEENNSFTKLLSIS